MRVACSKVRDDAILEAVSKLPEKEQLAVRAPLSSIKCKSNHGIRYTTQWIYECILLRVKSRKAYVHLRNHKILTLPSLQTLQRYLMVVKGAYGFQNKVFEVLKLKTANMAPTDVRGVLLLDEMKLTRSLSYDQRKLSFEGFTNLGKHTPTNQKGTKGDHALIIMFQPFKGKWVQALGCFLSKGSASGTILNQLIMEAIILAEKAGLRVDAVTTDGASWNRSMWKIFGVNEEQVSVEHVVDPSRRLWFFSDFPHLIKCIRNFFTKHSKYQEIWTPDGSVSLKHWYALLDIEDSTSFQVKINYKIRKEHIQPKYFQKMNVGLAFQFFGAADALQIFKGRHPDLDDCEGTIQFCTKMKNLIRAMNIRTPMNALSPGNAVWQVLSDFIIYLKEWRSVTESNGYEFMSESSYYGLLVSLKGTLQICSFLVEQCGYDYLMTARLNQDSLEHFFGMMRDCTGSNDHPDSRLFIQMYRLVSTYSLVKPPKGCNVTGDELFQVLYSIKDIDDPGERREQWEAQIDTILDSGCHSDVLSTAFTTLGEHDYCSQEEPVTYAVAYMTGYCARKGSRFAKFIDGKPFICNDCKASLILGQSDPMPESHKLINIRSEGNLLHPSLQLHRLIETVEMCITQTVGKGEIVEDVLFNVTKAIDKISPLPLVGCAKHKILLSRRILILYLTIRMHFICKQANKNDNLEQFITQEKRKASKLAHSSQKKHVTNQAKQTNAATV